LMNSSTSFVSVVGSAFRNDFDVLAGEREVVDDFSVFALDEARVSVHTGDKGATVAGREAGIRPEFVSQGVRFNLIGTAESNHLFWVALVEKEIGPIARMRLVVISES